MSDERIQRELHKRAIGAYSLWMHSGDDPAACECNSDYFVAGYQSRQAEIDRLTAELAECKKDSERYRWLCASDWYIGPEPQGDTNVVSLYNESTDNEGLNLSKEIDAAMEATK